MLNMMVIINYNIEIDNKPENHRDIVFMKCQEKIFCAFNCLVALSLGVAIYILAHYLTCEVLVRKKESERYLVYLLFAIVAGYSLHAILNSFLFIDGQLQDGNVRLWMDVWEKYYLPGT